MKTESPTASPVKHESRRNGEVARLPKTVRHQINEMLDDGLPYARIIENLGDTGKHLRYDHVRSWKKGGYKDYLLELRLIDQCRHRRGRASALLQADNNIHGFQAAQQIATSQICEAITDFGGDILREALLANPMNYFRMLNSFARLTNGGLKCERHLADEARRAVLVQKEAPAQDNAGITSSSFHKMEQGLNLM